MEKKRRLPTPVQDALQHIVDGRDKPFLEERHVDSSKGRGVFTHKAIKPSSFVVQYRGHIFPHNGPKPKRKCGDILNNYLFEFSWKGERWCIDASAEDGTLGRLVNDDHISPNCEMKKIVCEGKPHLCLFAMKEIYPGEEITYNYGNSSYLWRSKFEDSEAASDFENAASDDDEQCDSGPSHKNDSFTNIKAKSRFSEEMSRTSKLQPNYASRTQQEDTAVSSDEHDSDGAQRPRKARSKPKGTSYTKKNYCYVCGEGYSKISRHLKRHADEEPDIAEAFASRKNSKERKVLLEILRNRGNYKHNQEVLKNNRGELKMKRLSAKMEVNAEEHAHCLYCKGMYKRRDIWRHASKCAFRVREMSETDGKTGALYVDALADSPLSQDLPSGMWNMLVTLKSKVASAVQDDFLLIELAQNFTDKHKDNPNKNEHIRQMLQKMGRLLIVLQEKSVFSFEAAIKPHNFSKVVEAVKDIAGFDEKTQIYRKASLALKLVRSLKKIASLVLAGFDGNEQIMAETNKFLDLCSTEWDKLVSQKLLASFSGQKVNNPSTVPFIRDVQVFYRYLETTSASAIEGLKTHESTQAYSALCRVILAQTSVLNKFSPEVSKMTLKAFQERDDTTQVLSKHFIRISIPSRTGQNIAVLLTSEHVSAMILLLSKREACGVDQDNPYLFAKPNSSSVSIYHGKDCIRDFSNLCSAKKPEHLRWVHLHKHIARVFQILNLENDELRHLAKLLGQDIRADREYYQSPEAAVELAKIAKLLLAMENGSLEEFKGNSLEEIEVENELETDVEDSPENGQTERANGSESNPSLQNSDAVEQQVAMEKQSSPLTRDQDALEHIKAHMDKPFLEERVIDPNKGSGVFTCEPIEPSTFVVEYRGKLSQKDPSKKKRDTLRDYLFDFSWNGANWCIDATEEDGTLGRLVNDDHRRPNCKMEKVVFGGKPHLCLFAVRKIAPDEEITYNYGDSSYPWRSTVEDLAEASSSAESGSDDEYVPDGEPSSDDHSNSDRDQRYQNLKTETDSLKKQSFVRRPVNASCFQEDETDDSFDFFTSDEDNDDHSLPKNYCYVCGNANSKIARHLFTHRKQEPEIAEVFALPPSSKERNRLLNELRKRGNAKHNQKVLKTGCGHLKVSTKAKTFAHCAYCKRMYSQKEMWLHMKKCQSKKCSKRGRSDMLTLVEAAALTNPKEVSQDVSKLLQTLNDELAAEVMNDPHILQVAQWCSRGNKSKTSRTNDTITHRLRQMGRLLLVLKKKSICSYEDAVKPQNFSRLVEAVREVAGFNEEKKSYQSRRLVRVLADSLKKIGYIICAKALKEFAPKQTTQEAETFLKLCDKEWSPPLQSNGNKIPTVSFIQDVQTFYQCLEETTASAVKSLSLYESRQVYTALLRVTAAHVTILNKNTAELSRMTLKSFHERAAAEDLEDASQPQLEQMLSKHFVKISVLNNGKKVAVTLTPKLLNALTLLASKREACGVHKDNPFFFARPDDSSTSFCQGQKFVNIFIQRSGAKDAESLRSMSFRKHVIRVVQILSLTNADLEELAKLLGRDIPTDRGHYQKPEAAVDVAKISELLSAMEGGSLEKFEGKSLEKIEIADELEPDAEQENPNNGDAEEIKESEASLLLADIFSGMEADCSWTASSKKRGRGRNRREERENEEPELNDEVNTGKDNVSQDMPVSRDVNKPGKPPSRLNDDVTKMSFSDDDEDMNVDFDIDTDEDNVRNDGDNDTNVPTAMPLIPDVQDVTKEDDESSHAKKADGSPRSYSTGADYEDTMDTGADYEDTMDTGADYEDTIETDAETDVGEKDLLEEGQQSKWMDVDSRSSPSTSRTEKKTKSAAKTGMKEVKIVLKKLDIFQTPVHISQLLKDQPSHDGSNQGPASSSSPTDLRNKPDSAKTLKMICSRCKKMMTKGQTAFQKKGFTDVFCSKTCLFALFPVNKPATRACHRCHEEISQPLDLIMAAVDHKGTMKDFCSVICLSAFKSNVASPQPPQSTCTMCSKSCTASCEMTLNDTMHKFCSTFCLENFCRDNKAGCDNCSSTCGKRPLRLKLKEETRTICSDKCVQEFKEKIKTSHRCPVCLTPRPVSDMVHYETSEDGVELFCNQSCVAAFKQWQKSKETTVLHQLKKRKRGAQGIEDLNTEDGNVADDASAAAQSDTPTISISVRASVCCHCNKKVGCGEARYQSKNSDDVFCSTSCLSERHPHMKLVTKKCYNCFQVMTHPNKVILAPVDDSGTSRELCSNACLSSVNSRRKMVPPPAGPGTECTMCHRFSVCKFKMNLDGVMLGICSDACYMNYHKVNNLPVLVCDICCDICPEKHLILKMEDNSKTICTEECLFKFKEMAPLTSREKTARYRQRVNADLATRAEYLARKKESYQRRKQQGKIPYPKSDELSERERKKQKDKWKAASRGYRERKKMEQAMLDLTPPSMENAPPVLKIEAPQLCPMCQTTHQLADMVENKDEEGRLDFFCSNRCLLVHTAQPLTVSESITPTSDNSDIKDVKPPLLKLIKEEPVEEEYSQTISPAISTKDIKDEPKVDKEDLKIGSVFPSTGSSSSSPPLTSMDLPASCSSCKNALVNGENVYQRKCHPDIFCSTSCLLKFYQTKPAKRTCHFCLQAITQPQNVLQAPVDTEETMKDFCSQTCLSCFNYKRVMANKIPIAPVASNPQCSMCSRYCISKHEIVQQDVVHKICSESCFHRFCNMNNISICDNCRSHCSSAAELKMKSGTKKLCSAECMAEFKQKVRTLQPCTLCSTYRLMSNMVENKNSEDVVELFCTSSCVMAFKIQAVCALGVPFNCDNCGEATVPACHLAMSDDSIRNFCTLTCAMTFKDTQSAATNCTAAANQTHSDFLRTPETLPCAQCQRVLTVAPKVVQTKDKMNFVCSLACSEEFKRVNNIMGKCEYCKNERIVGDARRVDSKDCYFCSDGCRVLFSHELEKRWGEHCQSCAFCHSISKTAVRGQYKGKEETFCSEECSAKYKILLYHVAKCDTCGRQGKLSQSLAMLGDVKHFCDLKCLLHFCNKEVQMKDTVSSPPRSADTVKAFPVITNVISLAGALSRQSNTSASSAHQVSVPDVPTKVVGHASVQTVPKKLKNKSVLCTPLVHNKGVSCTTQTVDAEAQTDDILPKVLPVPVPVYVPVPMNMYSQFTPKPVCLPLPLPVPMFIPVTPGGPVKSVMERIQPDLSEGNINLKSEMKETPNEPTETEGRQEDGAAAKEGHGQDGHAPNEHISNNKEDSLSDVSFHSLGQPHTHKKPPPVSDVIMPSQRQPKRPLSAPPVLDMRKDPPSPMDPEPAPPPLQRGVRKDHTRNRGQKLQQAVKDAKKETPRRNVSMATSRKPRKLKSREGLDAWKRWIRWRKSQTNLYLVSTQAAMLNEDVLRCSAAELSDGLCRFITEVKRPDGAPYSPDVLFYLCLGIQQHLFENGRWENIFSERTYNRFSETITKILMGFKPSATAGYIHSRIEEGFLWDCKQLGAYSPIVLLNTLLFFCCKYFGFTTVEQHRQLSFAHVVQYTKTNQDHSKTTFLRFYPPASVNKAGADRDGIPAKKRKRSESEDIVEMRENTENPLRCPVRLYEFYLSKCSEAVKQSTDMFYLLPQGSCVPNSPVWFSSSALDRSTMESMLVRILTVRELHGGGGGRGGGAGGGVDQRTSHETPSIPEEDSG